MEPPIFKQNRFDPSGKPRAHHQLRKELNEAPIADILKRNIAKNYGGLCIYLNGKCPNSSPPALAGGGSVDLILTLLCPMGMRR